MEYFWVSSYPMRYENLAKKGDIILKLKKIISYFLSIILVLSSYAPVFASSSIPAGGSGQYSDIDVVLTLGKSVYEPLNFVNDLKTRLTGLGVDTAKVNITGITQSEESIENTLKWDEYDHLNLYENERDYKANNPDHSKYWKKRHIVLDNQKLTFYGYGRNPYKDFMYFPDDTPSTKTFTFNFSESGVYYHSMEGAGFLFNTVIDKGIISGYCLLFGKDNLQIYKIDNIPLDNFHNISDHYNDWTRGYMKDYATLVSTFNKGAGTEHIIKIEASPEKIDLWDNNVKLIDSYALSNEYGYGFGPIASYAPHDCSILSWFTFEDLNIKIKDSKKFKRVIYEPQWRESSKRILVNFDDDQNPDFDDSQASAEIISKMLNEDIYYIGCGSIANKSQSEDFLARYSGSGKFILADNYEQTLDQIAQDISLIYQSSKGNIDDSASKPVSDFYIEVDKALNVTLTSSAYDPGHQNEPGKGIYQEEWKWKETSEALWKIGKPSVLQSNKNYIVALRVLDNEGIWSYTKTQIVSTNLGATLKSIPDFAISKSSINKLAAENSTIAVWDRSYDPLGETILEKEWTVRNRGVLIYEGTTPKTDFSSEVDGSYKLSLRVRNNNGWSAYTSRYLQIIDDNILPNVSISPEKGTFEGSTNISLNYTDEGGSGFACQKFAVCDSTITPITDWSAPESSNKRVVILNATGTWYIHYEAEDNKGNKLNGYFGPYNVHILTDDEAVQAAKATLNVGYAAGDYAQSVTQNVYLASAGSNNTKISWQSSRPDTISVNGEVYYRPKFNELDIPVTLIATISRNSVSDTRVFPLVVPKHARTGAAVTAADKALLEISYAAGDSAQSVTQNVYFIGQGTYGSKITWNTDTQAVISSEGNVRRPKYKSGDTNVTVSAEVYCDGATEMKSFVLKVLCEAPSADADLSALSTKEGSFDTAFDTNITNYSQTVSYNTDSITLEFIRSNENASIKVNGAEALGNSITVGLSEGKNTIAVVVTAEDGVTVKTYRIDVGRLSSSSNAGDVVSSNSGTPQTDMSSVATSINGKKYTFSTVTFSKENGHKIANIILDGDRVEERVKQEGKGAIVVLDVGDTAEVVFSQLNAQTLQVMAQNSAILEIRTEKLIYTLPALAIQFNEIVSYFRDANFNDINILIKISSVSKETAKLINNTAIENDLQILSDPIEMEITCDFGEKRLILNKFLSFVNRQIAIPSDVNPNKVSTGVVLNADGSLSPVPTEIVRINEKNYARVSSLTNSTYSLVNNSVKFSDIDEHWAQKVIEDLGERLIVSGVGSGRFEPDRDITRAEFVTIVLNGLGLLRKNQNCDIFADVTKKDWYYDAIALAYENNLIIGSADGKFYPDRTITREEAIVIIIRAMNLIGCDTSVSNDDRKYISNYTDFGNLSDWAVDSALVCIKNGIINGNNKLLSPGENATRAEVSAIIRRYLVTCKLISGFNR